MTRLLGEAELRAYQRRFDSVEESFYDAVRQCGLPFAEEEPYLSESLLLRERLKAFEVVEGNDGKSLWSKWISPACIACRKGLHTESFITSTQCPRNCFFCFNPNQPNYGYYQHHVNPLTEDLLRRHAAGERYDCLAVTGGEPLLHPDETVEFFKTARELYPCAHTRLYTSGYNLDQALVKRLARVGLNEVRFSVKLSEGHRSVSSTLASIASCVGEFPAVMVEMPVMPDEEREMKQLLCSLDTAGVTGINLLELGFPYRNADEFLRRGYLLKPHPYRVVYGYGYSGGLPVQGSEVLAMKLMEFSFDANLDLGVHYCSVENRLTGQIYRQNSEAAASFPLRVVSEKDGFLKSAKVFGDAIEPSLGALEEMGLNGEIDVLDGDNGFLEMPLGSASALKSVLPQVAVGVSYGVAEECSGGYALREVKLEVPDLLPL